MPLKRAENPCVQIRENMNGRACLYESLLHLFSRYVAVRNVSSYGEDCQVKAKGT
jgi:hypothetical protein